MNVKELNHDELLELKEILWQWSDADICLSILPEMTKEQKEICDKADCSNDIPDELIFELYDGIHFVKEDFWCNI